MWSALLLSVPAVTRSFAQAASASTFLGPAFLPTDNPSQTLSHVANRIMVALAAAAENGSTSYGNFTSGGSSIAILAQSAFEQSPILDFSYTSNVTQGSLPVSKDSIFRIGSVSKVFTVYTLLAAAGFKHFDNLVVDHVPELQKWVHENPSTTDASDWGEITLGALASQLSGTPRDYNLADLSSTSFNFVAGGLPPLNATEVPQCGVTTPCSRSEFFEGFVRLPATFSVYQTPSYSNAAFRILAYAISSITNRAYSDVFRRTITQALALSHTTLEKPISSIGNVILSNDESQSFDLDLGDEAPTGGMYSSASDLVSFGNSILSHSRLSRAQTDRWLKPHSHTASSDFSVGMPWEIRRARLSGGDRTTDLYTKSGSVGIYNSQLILLPDYGITVAVLTAGPDGAFVDSLSNIVTDALLPALENAAKSTTCNTYCGTYSASHLNSTISLTTDQGPGLIVRNWINNGSDIVKTAEMYTAATNGGQLKAVRLFPSITSIGESSRAIFRAVFETEDGSSSPGLFRAKNGAWASAGELVYGKAPVDEFIFDVKSQRASGVLNAATRCYLHRDA